VKGTIEYLKKEDPTPLIDGVIPDVSKESRDSKSDLVAKMIASGSSLKEVADEYPGYFLLNQSKITSFRSFCMSQKATSSLKKLKLPISYSGERPEIQSLVEWLNGNLNNKRPFKAKQLFIYGPPNVGKTTLLSKLGTYLRIYEMPLHEDFYDLYDDDNFDLVFLDEFKGQKSIGFLNQWSQGYGKLSIKKKGSQGLKMTNLPFIICSNYSIDQCYKEIVNTDSLKVRFEEIFISELIDFENIEFIEDAPKLVNSEKEEEIVEIEDSD